MKDKIQTVFGILFVSFFFGSYMIPIGIYHHFQIVCTNKNIPYATITTDDPTTFTNSITTHGVNGTERDCKRGGTKLVSKTITKQPVQQVALNGTKPLKLLGNSESNNVLYGSNPDYYDSLDDNSDSNNTTSGGSYYGQINSAGCPKNQYVNGYTRSDGTYVNGYYRNSPNDNCQ